MPGWLGASAAKVYFRAVVVIVVVVVVKPGLAGPWLDLGGWVCLGLGLYLGGLRRNVKFLPWPCPPYL